MVAVLIALQMHVAMLLSHLQSCTSHRRCGAYVQLHRTQLQLPLVCDKFQGSAACLHNAALPAALLRASQEHKRHGSLLVLLVLLVLVLVLLLLVLLLLVLLLLVVPPLLLPLLLLLVLVLVLLVLVLVLLLLLLAPLAPPSPLPPTLPPALSFAVASK
jgi:hypothetical protein